jgi:homoserine kinase type II
MAVYTQLSDSDLANLLAEYDIGTATSCKGIAEGVENSNFALARRPGQYILTIFEKRTNEADLPFFMQIMERSPCAA